MGLHRSPGRGSRDPGSLVPGAAAASWECAETAHPQATASGRQDVRTQAGAGNLRSRKPSGDSAAGAASDLTLLRATKKESSRGNAGSGRASEDMAAVSVNRPHPSVALVLMVTCS